MGGNSNGCTVNAPVSEGVHRPRRVVDWVDKATGKKLHVDENDLWICAQAKERDLVFLTADRKIHERVSDADPCVRFLLL